jgi:hypothetical protein
LAAIVAAQKLSKVNNDPMGENSPNLFTLLGVLLAGAEISDSTLALKSRVARWFIYKPKNSNLGKFLRVIDCKMLIYFMDI